MKKMTKKTKNELLTELDNPHLINTYKKIIDQSKKSLCEFINNPNNETWAKAYQNLCGIPFLEGEYTDLYDVHEDHLGEIRDKLNVLADLFMQYYIQFTKDGLEYDNLVRHYVEDDL